MFMKSLCLTAALWAAPLTAQTVTAGNPQSVVDAIQALGYRATLTTDPLGKPLVQSAIEGINYVVYFYSCGAETNDECLDLLFSARFVLDSGGVPMSLANDWNTMKLFGEAVVDEDKNPGLTYFITTVGGLSQENFTEVVKLWGITVSQFKDHIGW